MSSRRGAMPGVAVCARPSSPVASRATWTHACSKSFEGLHQGAAHRPPHKGRDLLNRRHGVPHPRRPAGRSAEDPGGSLRRCDSLERGGSRQLDGAAVVGWDAETCERPACSALFLPFLVRHTHIPSAVRHNAAAHYLAPAAFAVALSAIVEPLPPQRWLLAGPGPLAARGDRRRRLQKLAGRLVEAEPLPWPRGGETRASPRNRDVERDLELVRARRERRRDAVEESSCCVRRPQPEPP